MPKFDEDDSNLSFLPIEEAVIPPPGFIQHLKDHYWIVHPEKGLVFWRKFSPQCNSNEQIAKRIAEAYPWAKVQLIPSVFRKINPNDYV